MNVRPIGTGDIRRIGSAPVASNSLSNGSVRPSANVICLACASSPVTSARS